ncbi:MAG TPA: alpha/beta hydrolase [Terracidiphilus sp.]|jgi:hypothetical protein
MPQDPTNRQNLIHRILFTTALTCTSRVVQMRDRLLGRVPRSRPECGTVRAEQQTIRSEKNLLDAVFVEPATGKPNSAVLICHGIGEMVAQWFPIQRMLAESGIASLVFDYSGYGRSTGFIDFTQCEQDAVASFHVLQDLAPGVPISLLGFSLGTGVAPAILDHVTPERIILCAGYSSFRKAARAAWIPGIFAPIVPPIWSAEKALRNCILPILIVQGEHDRLFRMQMANELVACSGGRAELLVLPARSHNAPFYYPDMSYWGPIIDWMLKESPKATSITMIEQ